jgi:hypothetical protein
MKLSEHFTLSEFTDSPTAKARGINNTPPQIAEDNLRRLCLETLEPIRALVGGAVRITSGYRSAALNSAIDGSARSVHVSGFAADFKVKGMTAAQILEKLKASPIPFDQAIGYDLDVGGHVHVGIKADRNDYRRQTLWCSRVDGKKVYRAF